MLSARPYLSLIQTAALEAGIRIEPIEPDILYRLSSGGASWVMYGVDPGLNDSLGFQLAKYKSLTYAVLADAGIPAVPHHFLANPDSERGDPRVYEEAEQWLRRYGPPLVVKPDDGAQGRLVMRVREAAELRLTLEQVFAKVRHVSVSPYRPAEREYRIVVLDGQAMLQFAKQRPEGEWRHNLALGARPAAVEPELEPALRELAVRSAASLGLSFCTVDVLNVTDVGLQVLEVNGTVYLSEYMKHSPAHKEAVYRLFVDVFRSKVRRMRQSRRPVGQTDKLAE
jgi:ribosomal protein S6--L-glutamate ligase